jgi:ribosomal protein S18 acetylase RimI-like enzyme
MMPSRCPVVPLSQADLPVYAEVIRNSFATAARDFRLTKDNCPTHPSLTTNEQFLERYKLDYSPFGVFQDGRLAGFVALINKGNGVFMMNNLAVLPEFRHAGHGKTLMDFCKAEVKKRGGVKIVIDIIEENTVLKDWYAANGFKHTGAQKFSHLPFTSGHMEWKVEHV